MTERKSAPTIKDVAAAANVSTATVSKFINRLQRFSPDVESRLAEAIKTLGYHQNPMARSMATGRSRTLGLSIPDMHNQYFAALVQGANRVAMKHGYSLLLVDSEENASRERQLLEDLCMRVDGLMIHSKLREDEMEWAVELSKPHIFFDRREGWGKSQIDSYNRDAGYMVTNYLVRSGHRRIVYVGFNKARADEERYAGAVACLKEHGMSLPRFETDASSPQEGARLCSKILLGSEPVDAVICFNDMIAIGFLKHASELGFSVPDDCSVVGFDNIPFGEYVTPALTSVDMGGESIGAIATQHLIDIINGKESRAVLPEPELVLRKSTAGRRSRGD
ncbi:LacI family transcriptional regulator [Burkholderia sp. Nafp2/4-1b]|uniref:LacI family DNA-binding transcriptional regulator n=1 Tax=Burkholderia sp. Nafp2/4-1b TaxID=2116686 RepID=UPI000EF91EE8|nr:LacI family DNA-binding transcriptional regulator [Burkholderia sp. Nafp2/4-1b]RKU00074.1 LacI family transcriptional regulator [Burkholderia sp. Nafp2/4-1b]